MRDWSTNIKFYFGLLFFQTIIPTNINSTALFLLIPTSHSTNSLFWPLLIGECWALISIAAGFYMLYIERELNKIRSVNDKNSMKTDTNFIEAIRIINKDSNRISIYGIITILFSCKCIADVLFYESESAYVYIFNISDSLADRIVSLPSISIFSYISKRSKNFSLS